MWDAGEGGGRAGVHARGSSLEGAVGVVGGGKGQGGGHTARWDACCRHTETLPLLPAQLSTSAKHPMRAHHYLLCERVILLCLLHAAAAAATAVAAGVLMPPVYQAAAAIRRAPVLLLLLALLDVD